MVTVAVWDACTAALVLSMAGVTIGAVPLSRPLAMGDVVTLTHAATGTALCVCATNVAFVRSPPTRWRVTDAATHPAPFHATIAPRQPLRLVLADDPLQGLACTAAGALVLFPVTPHSVHVHCGVEVHGAVVTLT